MKIWAKLFINYKNVKDILIENSSPLTYKTYEILLRELADTLDIPTALTLRSQYNDLVQFHIHRYKASDFVESFDYDFLEIENFSEED